MEEEDSIQDDERVCEHDEVHRDKAIWVKPSRAERIHSPTQKRTYCRKCGKIKYVGSAGARKLGYYINLLKEVQRKVDVLYRRKITKHRLTNVQLRLIIKELKTDDYFLDRFANNREAQYNLLKRSIMKYCSMPEEIIDSVYRDFKG